MGLGEKFLGKSKSIPSRTFLGRGDRFDDDAKRSSYEIEPAEHESVIRIPSSALLRSFVMGCIILELLMVCDNDTKNCGPRLLNACWANHIPFWWSLDVLKVLVTLIIIWKASDWPHRIVKYFIYSQQRGIRLEVRYERYCPQTTCFLSPLGHLIPTHFFASHALRPYLLCLLLDHPQRDLWLEAAHDYYMHNISFSPSLRLFPTPHLTKISTQS